MTTTFTNPIPADVLKNAHIIQQDNFDSWSQGYDVDGYLKVLPHPDEKIPFDDPLSKWQEDNQDYKNGNFVYEADDGSYFSSWGPKEILEVTLTLDELEEILIDGFGTIQAGELISNNLEELTSYQFLRAYNGKIPGPMLITEPGDTLRITLQNNLDDQVTNLHTHGLHVSPMGNGDNVLIAADPGDDWVVEIEIPENHFIGPDWYHPHLHGTVNLQVSSGLAGYLLINPPHDLPDLEKFDPVTQPSFFMALNTFGIQQIDRTSAPDDPLNQSDPEILIPAGTPLEELEENVFSLSDAPYVGYNAKPIFYDPQSPAGGFTEFGPLFRYGDGTHGEATENVIHTVNGQYNPTMEVGTGEWTLFSFANMSVNSFHVIQLIKEDEQGNLSLEEVQLVAIDGDAAGVVEDIRRNVTETPIVNPGSRISVQHIFDEPGKYYFLSNATEELLGDDAPILTSAKGFNDGHVIWGSQVLGTVEVTGEEIPPEQLPPFPEPYDVLVEQSDKINELVDSALAGDFDEERTFVWDANFGGATQQPGEDPITFEGIYTINGEFFATSGGGMPALTMPMVGTSEVWNIVNSSGVSNPEYAEQGRDFPLTEWHPFHIHQNDFVVLEINGIPVEEMEQNYLARVLSDTIALPPSHAPGSATPENPFGITQFNGDPSVVKILMEFADFPGSYVNHCHILFHEDAGMMAVVRVILNTNDTWLSLSTDNGNFIRLFTASNTNQNVRLNAYNFSDGVDVAIADVNYKNNLGAGNTNVTDNVTDVVTIQKQLTSLDQQFTVKVFDGESMFQQTEAGASILQGDDSNLLLAEIRPFANITPTLDQTASIASGDVNGDGFADIMAALGGGIQPLIEIYSGQDYSLMAQLNLFHHGGFTGTINVSSGDINGDNFDDILVAQGAGGEGKVEAYSGILLDGLIRSGEITDLSGNDVAHETAMFSEAFQPYGDSYTGEIEITSGYVLQTPEIPNDSPSQTNAANITTVAIGDLPAGQEPVKIHSFLGGGHHSSSDHSGDNAEGAPEIRLDKEFTPSGNIEEIAGTFADINGDRGQGVLFTQDGQGNNKLIHLQEQNIPEEITVESPVTDLFDSPFYRFQNKDIPSTYLYAGEQEAQNIRQNFPNFQEEGFAFNASVTPNDELISLYRFQNMNLPGTYLYVGEQERQSVLANFPNFTEEGLAFYAFGADANKGQDIYRFQNINLPGTYLYVGEQERQSVLANFPNFVEEGIAFEVLT